MKLHATRLGFTCRVHTWTDKWEALETHRNRELGREVRHGVVGKHRVGGGERVGLGGPEVRRWRDRSGGGGVSGGGVVGEFEEVVDVVEEVAAVNVVDEVSDHFPFFISLRKWEVWVGKMEEKRKGEGLVCFVFKVLFVWRMSYESVNGFEIRY